MQTHYPPTRRVDAEDKVRGRPLYAADRLPDGLLHAVTVGATIGRGRLAALHIDDAAAMPGVRHVLTHADMAHVQPPGFVMGGGYAVQSLQPMLGTRIAYRGQPIALVVAETLEAASAAAHAVRAEYAPDAFRVQIDGAPESDIVAQQGSPLPQAMFADRVAGDADAAYAAAEVRIDSRFTAPAQHQNPMELLATVAEWRGDRLVIHEGTQNSGAIRHGIARQLGIPPERVEVVSPQVGGGFGQKNSLQGQTVLAAVAARISGRPVKLVITRAQTFHQASFRPASRHRVRLGATSGGRITAAIHEVDQQTSRHDLFPAVYADVTSRFYGVANFRGRERLVRTDVQTPGYMRAPYEHTGSFAYESAVDELAVQLGLDPVQLRLANDTATDPITGKPFSSRHVRQTLEEGARRFGWDRRSPTPGSMRTPAGDLLGMGVAIGLYKGATAAAGAVLEVTADGAATIAVSGHEMGQGLRSTIANYLADRLALTPGQIRISVGEPGQVAQHLTAGSWGTATALRAAGEAVDTLAAQLGVVAAEVVRELHRQGRASARVDVRSRAPGQPEQVLERLETGQVATVGPEYPDFVTMSSIAHFVEVHIAPGTRRIRVARVVSIADCGATVSPVTAASQVRGGVVWGIGGTLHEISESDPRFGGFLNASLEEYVTAVNADIGSIEVGFVGIPDARINGAGAKGLGEVVMAGVAPAIANAVFHATGRRYRDLPIRLDRMFGTA
ncbi:xanthine dehydrogenase family protein molybdopterin-binding subunit [Luteimonas sp BLCC-B24]|uniref:xanthine dehydrogenase family protein molybdopterin-binding subunit n=1 Tax=Luteimonas sp. BLCC-B24 TaxID=3025317 RepID=UPI00234DCA62|nr:xanthine dehydrogenase family protein molybdopterin-binding subunit [Luteimonas sp. BLCC-B24]MDC7806766.1 xanthine dehydrogenase family protein molybdopterin-binding subunit [Luteimonas sp. BLCC-B24]